MNKPALFLFATVVWIATFASPALCQSKSYLVSSIQNNLNASLQVKKKRWEHSFSQDSCVFHKIKIFKEKDGLVMSKQRISIPLGKVNIEVERKKYDSFFTCHEDKNCIEHKWFKGSGKLIKSRAINQADLFVEQPKVAENLYSAFVKLQDLCSRRSYPGPVNIKWGQSHQRIKSILPDRFRFMKEEGKGLILTQHYEGSFSGLDTNGIAIRYVDSKFYQMDVDVKRTPSAPVLKKWLQVVKMITEKYGAPDRVTLPANVKRLEDLNARTDIAVLEQQIANNYWIPDAAWTYDNKGVIRVSVQKSLGHRKLLWQFYQIDLRKIALNEIKRVPVEDF